VAILDLGRPEDDPARSRTRRQAPVRFRAFFASNLRGRSAGDMTRFAVERGPALAVRRAGARLVRGLLADAAVDRVGRAGDELLREAASSRQARQAPATTAGSATAPAQSASLASSDQYSGGASARAITRRN
jgi:hypothetical protein